MKNLVIGITGGIGSGKSTVSEFLTKNNHTVLFSDDIAREIMQYDSAVIESIKKEFGNECYNNNQLNPKILAEKVFGHAERINKLNSIVHPPTIKKIEEEISSSKRTENLLFVESALIFEANMENLFDYILLVTADEDIRIKRTVNRGIETVSEIKDRMSHQISEEHKRGRSDFVIENNSSMEELKTKVFFFLDLFKTLK